MRSGCLNLLLLLVAAAAAAALTVVGAILFVSFATLTFESPVGIEAILQTVVAVVAGFFFIRVGWSVWRDLRGRRPEARSGKGEQEERGSGGR
jgi:type VI protein secretion system component VasK